MTPAMFTRSGMYVEPPAVCLRPTIRFAYWIGIRRWPSWMKTTAATIAIATSGKNSRSIVPPLYQAAIPVGADERIEPKISSEMPLPTPRFVISSPIHIRSVVPARDPRSQPGQREDHEGEQDALAKLGDAPGIGEPGKH